ncbi:MAG: hypothetical protein J5486_11250 [Bacteroidaceae bacterium]|nr:hypothetical protein [Bacteroidaceae bacterium]
MFNVQCSMFNAFAQIKIGGNVYGGGNQGNVGGSTSVTVKAGDIGVRPSDADEEKALPNPRGKVFGGARMANVGGNTFVNIDGENATGYIVANYVYGGNDIAGTIGTAAAVNEDLPKKTVTTTDPTTQATTSTQEPILTAAAENGVDKTWNSYVRISSKATVADNKKIYIGQLFAGGNGEYDYKSTPVTTGTGENAVTKVTHEIYKLPRTENDTPIATKVTNEGEVGFVEPELDRTYLEVLGGSIVYAYGGGNNATVKDKTIIHVDNPTNVVNEIMVDATTGKESSAENSKNLLSTGRFLDMGINTGFSYPSSGAYQIGRFFGGNNRAEMAIQPQWNLKSGKIRNLYSGGNQGAMTHPKGILLTIPDGSTLEVDNVYGGCRMADVRPLKSGTIKDGTAEDVTEIPKLDGYYFPPNFAAHLLINGGKNINNVYGGNDVRGRVYFGNAVGIATKINGNVYGGGNGSYPYTDNSNLANDPIYGDLYYEVPSGKTSVEALNDIRPDAEQVSVMIRGKETGHDANGNPVTAPTIIGGSVYCGGNSATLKMNPAHAELANYPVVELKIGTNAIADNVFLGNNGERMVYEDILRHYAYGVIPGNATTIPDGYQIGDVVETGGTDFSQINLTDPNQMATYMEGAAMDLIPQIVYEDEAKGDRHTYQDYSSFIGSLFLGGNVGSMTYKGKNTMNIDAAINIYDKIVGGCNNAFVPQSDYNAFYDGGILGFKGTYENQLIDERKEDANGKTAFEGQDRLELNLGNVTITPLRWKDDNKDRLIWNTNKWFEYTRIKTGTTLKVGDEYYTYDSNTKKYTKCEVEDADRIVTDSDEFYEECGDFVPVDRDPDDEDIRLLNGNIYGGCYNSGHVNGNIVININEDVLKKDEVFGTGTGPYGRQASGVDYEGQRDDVMAVALTTFGAGCGYYTEVWGSTTINLNKGYAFQVFGGGERGFVGKGTDKKDNNGALVMIEENGKSIGIPERTYAFDPAYSTTVNLNGTKPIYTADGTDPALAETEYIYGAGNEGDVCGNSYVNLGSGRIYDAFGGASDADIYGHTEVIIGRQPDGSGGYKSGFPFVRDIVYGGNDFGGEIKGAYETGYNFKARIENYDQKKSMIHGYQAPGEGETEAIPEVLQSATYVEYLMGRVDTIFGGGYGYYDYRDKGTYGEDAKMPYQNSSFVNIRPNADVDEWNTIKGVFGGGTGYPKNRQGDQSQDRSYVLIDIPKGVENFAATEVFGSGSYNGLGMRFTADPQIGPAGTFASTFDPDKLSAIIDLLHGQIGTAYGGSYNEGVTARTVVNVPAGSDIKIQDIFGGAYGTQILPPCDVFESNVNYDSDDAIVYGAIFGGNNNERRTLYAKVNISGVVNNPNHWTGVSTVYGAGRGINSWAEYTEVNLNSGAKVREVYGGGEMGHVLNAESVQQYMRIYEEFPSKQIAEDDPKWKKRYGYDPETGVGSWKQPPTGETLAQWQEEWAAEWADAWTLGEYYKPDVDDNNDGIPDSYDYTGYAANKNTNLTNDALVTKTAEIDDRDYTGYEVTDTARYYRKYNTNVLIHEGAEVARYAYGGGLGESSTHLSGDIYGSTYIALLGGKVGSDIYAAGTSGGVYDLFGVGAYDATNNKTGFTASANAYIKGGTVRNVYGGGWEGHVGKHTKIVDGKSVNADISDSYTDDIYGETHVVIGKADADTTMTNTNTIDKIFASGVPAIQRNVYAGGEGGSVWGTANLTINNGYIGYLFENTQNKDYPYFRSHYIENVTEKTANDLDLSGNAFGGGYIVNSYVDNTNIKMYGGTIRGSLYGGGEVGPIGGGTTKKNYSSNGIVNGDVRIFRAGKTNVQMFNGHVCRNVFGGGRGQDSWGGDGTAYMDANFVESLKAVGLFCKGYVFGQTGVSIHGGEIGTDEGVALGYGNVFGAGDVSYVYSAYKQGENLYYGQKSGKRFDSNIDESNYTDEGYYYKAKKNGDSYAYIDDKGDPIGTTGEKIMTEDCKVLVEPWLQVKNTSIPYDGKTYEVGEYIPIGYLNTLPKKEKASDEWTAWSDLDTGTKKTINDKTVFTERGVIIHNAVFAGGNIASGTELHANTTTVFGNATASIHDAYHRDLITVGTGHTGGLYGDGNLTLVDGYRGLNITSYGTDYYSIDSEIGLERYENQLPPREKAYYELRYKCLKECTDRYGSVYKPASGDTKASTITTDDLVLLFLTEKTDGQGNYVDKDGNPLGPNDKPYMISVKDGTTDILVPDGTTKWKPNPAYWIENGVCSRYAGRIMNTIQRADFCGVFGSRMVMQGAQDRVPETLDYTNYTINRVREVSLNKKESIRKGEAYTTPDTGDDLQHGNYFGIYSVVNYLGALTSDVDFKDAVRYTDNKDAETYKCAADGKAYETATFYDWKKAFHKDRKRNNGKSHNQLALASGVYLELVTEKSTGNTLEKKDWGLITGVVELDLINVATGVGGGYVYAKNVHGERQPSGKTHTTLAALNKGAVTYKKFKYSDPGETDDFEMSGNFVHNTQTIIDDCFNKSGMFIDKNGVKAVPAHYWYIKGTIYIYDQYISAYTGSPDAYTESVDIPLTIAAASHGKVTLRNVQPNLYAYYSNSSGADLTKLTETQKLNINETTYMLNDPITYWDWYMLPASEKQLFVPETYVTTEPCKIKTGNEYTFYPAGYVMLPVEYTAFATAAKSDKQVVEAGEAAVPAVMKMVKDDNGNYVEAKDDDNHNIYLAFDDVFHSSNNLGHNTGFILTYDVNNPAVWDQWYSPKNGGEKINTAEYEKTTTVKDNYYDGPTYTPSTPGLYGQREYANGDIISQKVQTTYTTAKGKWDDATVHNTLKPQASFEKAYLVTEEYATSSHHYNAGAPIPESQKTSLSSSGLKAVDAYICTNTIQLSATEFITAGDLMTEAQKTEYYDRFNKTGATDAELAIAKDINDLIIPAYYCTSKTKGEEGYEGPYYYGGDYYETGHNYRGKDAWSGMSPDDRKNFTFNYDALDLLIDPDYGGKEVQKYQYDSPYGTFEKAKENPAGYSIGQPIDYTATFDGKYNNGSTEKTINSMSYTYTYDDNGTPKQNTATISKDQELQPLEYEMIPNEQRYYVQIKPTEANKYAEGDYRVYIANTDFENRYGPFTAGQIISNEEYREMGNEGGRITELKFTGTASTYYFCREAYTIGQYGDVTYTSGSIVTPTQTESLNTIGKSVTAAKIGNNRISNVGDDEITSGEVPVGYVISENDYKSLTNMQLGFSIHGTAPRENTTLYVSRESVLEDLTKEKIITVVYQYDYEESNEAGTQITPVSERHVVNIHINFKSGIPIIDEINAPDVVLPGTSITMRTPNIKPGAYEILRGGWELFERERDAISHTNGKEYTPSVDSLYWYQDGFLLAYYAKTYLGKTYSNYVPVTVANYHDLKNIMDDKKHHLNVDYDRTRLKRNSKVYINNYSGAKDGLDQLRDFYDLSLLTPAKTDLDDYGLITSATSSTFEGHKPLNNSTEEVTIDGTKIVKGVKAGTNLEFYLRTDIDHTGKTWNPIGDESATGQCFKGNLHGDGHTISGLEKSLFNNLCGDVYNLGVTGSFTGAGVVETGTGYVESSWIHSSSTADKTKQPVFGNPSRTSSSGDLVQVVNSYYQEDATDAFDADGTTPKEGSYTKKIADSNNSAYGTPTRKSAQDFYTGEVAYDLNNFYLFKRYSDQVVKEDEGLAYNFYKKTDSGLSELQTGFYANDKTLCSSGYNKAQYVEDRFEDGDFRYAAGTIPSSEDERYYVDTKDNDKEYWFPIWPDDYLFFGQALNYDHVEGRTHQNVPAAINRSGGRVDVSESGNRVYRAPAYFRSKTMGVAYYNPYAVFAQSKNGDSNTLAYKDMTAIDFTDAKYGAYETYKAYEKGTVNAAIDNKTTELFYPPLLDDEGISGFKNIDLTQNLLVYTLADGKTATTVSSYLTDPLYAETTTAPVKTGLEPDRYRAVDEQETINIHGHWVQQAGETYLATRDHLLVDRQDFNAPIEYKFMAGTSTEAGTRMWYQRKPNNFVEPDWTTAERSTKGWEGVSLPFSAELVTTNQKGEITHFYSGSLESKNGTHSKIGHEYWLREFKKISSSSTPAVAVADFNYPTASSSDFDKTVTNTFLWDYYYEGLGHNQKDLNKDSYQTYYQPNKDGVVNTFLHYPMLTAGSPYIIGFPGATFLEFDLSGSYVASTTANTKPEKLDPQVITFASEEGATIHVSDDETAGVAIDGYTFKPSYMNSEMKEYPTTPTGGETYEVNYTLNESGNSYNLVTQASPVKTVAFRPYFEGTFKAPANGVKEYKAETRSIIFNRESSEMIGQEENEDDITNTGRLYISAKEGMVVVHSTLSAPEKVRIVNTAGALIDNYTIQPGETIETSINASGVYVVNKKKLSVKIKE